MYKVFLTLLNIFAPKSNYSAPQTHWGRFRVSSKMKVFCVFSCIVTRNSVLLQTKWTDSVEG